MGNQQSHGNYYPSCSEDQDYSQDLRQAQGNDKDKDNKGAFQHQEYFDDYFGKVVIITKKILKNTSHISSNACQIDYQIQNDSNIFENGETQKSSVVLEKAFKDQNQLNKALNQVKIFQNISHPNIMAIQSIQSNIVAHSNEGKLYIGRVNCDYYPQNLNNILKQRKQIVQSLQEKSYSSTQNTQRNQASAKISSNSNKYKLAPKQSNPQQNTPQNLTPRTDRESFITAFTEKEIWYMLDALVDGLKLFQERQIIHGDLRPQTIYLTEQGYIKLSIIQCFAQDYSHTNFHIAASHILKGKSLQQKIIDDNLLLSLEQLVQLKRLNISNSARQSQKSANLTKEILQKLEFNPYKSQVFSLGILLLQVIFCGSIQTCQPLSNNLSQNTSRKNTTISSQSQLTTRRSSFSQSPSNQIYLYTFNEKTKDISINFQLIFDLLIHVKTKFSPSLFKILNLCLEINEKNRVDCIQLYNELHSLDLQTEVSMTIDESVVIRQPLQTQYQQGIANLIKNPSFDQYLLQKSSSQQICQSNFINNNTNQIKLLANKQSGNQKITSTFNQDNQSHAQGFSSPNQDNKQEKSLNNFYSLNEQSSEMQKKDYNPNQFFNVSLQRNKSSTEKKQIHHTKNISVDIMQTNYPTATASTNGYTTTLNTITNNNFYKNEFQTAKTDQQNKIEPVQKGITILGQENDPISYTRMTDILNTNTSALTKDNFKRYSVPSVFLNIVENKKDTQFEESEQVKKSKKGMENLHCNNLQDQINKNISSQGNSIKSGYVSSTKESIPTFGVMNNKQMNQSINQSMNCNNQSMNQNYNSVFKQLNTNSNNLENLLKENQNDTRVSNISEHLTLTGQRDFSGNMQKDNLSAINQKDYLTTSNYSTTIREPQNTIPSQNLTFATTRKQSDTSSTANYSISTNFQFYHPQSNYLNSLLKKNEFSSPNYAQSRVSSMHAASTNEQMQVENQSDLKDKNLSCLNIIDKSASANILQSYATNAYSNSNHDYYNFVSHEDQKKDSKMGDQNCLSGISQLYSPSNNSKQNSIISPHIYNSSQTIQNNSTNQIQLKNILLSQPLPSSDKSFSQQIGQSSYLQTKPNSTAIDKNSSWNFKSDNVSQFLSQPLTSPKDPIDNQISEFNFKGSQFIQQSVDLTSSQHQQFLSENNININTYTFSSPQRTEKLYSSNEKAKYESQQNPNQQFNNLDHPLQQTAKFISESSRHQYSTSLYDKFPFQEIQKEEHVYGSPKKVIVSQSNVQSPRNLNNTLNTQRNKSIDQNSSNLYLKQISSSPLEEYYSEKIPFTKNNSSALLILSPSHRYSSGSQNGIAATYLEKSYLNSLVKNAKPVQNKEYLVQQPQNSKMNNMEVNIQEFNSQKNDQKNLEKNDLLEKASNNDQSTTSNDQIEIKEWNDIESEMSDTLQQSTSEGVQINNTIKNEFKGSAPLLNQNQFFNQLVKPSQQQQINFQKKVIDSQEQNRSHLTQIQNSINNQTNSQNFKTIKQDQNNKLQNQNSVVYQINNIQNISNSLNRQNSNSQQQQSSKVQLQNKISMHRKVASYNSPVQNIQVNIPSRSQAHSIHQQNIISPKDVREFYDYKIRQPSLHTTTANTNSDIQNNTSGNNSILLLNQQKQPIQIEQNYNNNNNNMNQTNQSNLQNTVKVMPSNQNMTIRDISQKELTNLTLNSTKISSTRGFINPTESSFCAPYSTFDGAKKIALLANYDTNSITQKQISNKKNVSVNNTSLQSQTKLNFMLSPSSIPTQIGSANSQFKSVTNNKILKEFSQLQKAPFQLNLKQQLQSNNDQPSQQQDKFSNLKQNLNLQQQKSFLSYQQNKYTQDSFLSKNSIL